MDVAETSYGTLVGDLSAEEARTVSVLLAGATVPLRDLLAGAACSTPREQWPKQPDTMLGTTPAWGLHLTSASGAGTGSRGTRPRGDRRASS
ncbi:MAG: hypothetical protein HY909_15115 [Deltaproteobacteria bacterium]|nr:hypothetical protein [Deltaproteobacteria bacterium]